MNDEIIVVTGLARSGTTCMMRMLEAGGIPVYYDNTKPLEFRENGREYLNYNIILRETDKIKQLQAGDGSWLRECKGMAIKILTPSRAKIPKDYAYKFIYMDRKIKHMVNSQQKYVMRSKQKKMPIHDIVLDRVREMRSESIKTLRGYPDSDFLVVKFEQMINAPESTAIKVGRFLGADLDIKKMVGVVVKRPAFCLPIMMEEKIYRS